MLLKIVLLSALFLDAKPYATAVKEHVDKNKPMVVYIGATWCTYCGPFKSELRSKVANRTDVVYTELDADKDRLSSQMMNGDKVPQTVIYYHENKKPMKAVFVGGGSATKIEKFLERLKKD